MNFEDHLKQEMTTIRQAMADVGLGSMWLSMFVTGRTEAGELKIEFQLGPDYDQGNAKGGSLDAVVTEAIRRAQWKAANAPLCLPSGEI